MKVNSFFCGAGGFDLGFLQEGFEIVGAWDYDKYAIQSYNYNIGHAIQADINDMKGSDIQKAAGWTFGFPCQDISISGNQAGMVKGVTRSGLFYEIMRLLKEVHEKPRWILAENVKQVKKYIPTIKEEYNKAGYSLVYALYNSKYQGVPQNRERYFLLGIRNDLNNPFQFQEQEKTNVPNLLSILETNVDEKYFMKKNIFLNESACGMETDKTNVIGTVDMKGMDIIKRIYSYHGISPTLTTSEGGHRQPKIIEPQILNIGNVNPSGRGMNGSVYLTDGLSPTCTTNKGEGHKVTDGFRIRKLTPREYARLQGFPESYEQVVSNSQFYKQMGNAVTVNVAAFVAKQIKEQLEG